MSLNTADLPELGVSLIDEQHRHYVTLVASTLISIDTGDLERKDIEKLLDDLLEFCIEHFDAEGYLMRVSNYSHAADHEAEHETFRRNIEQVLEHYLEEIDTNTIVIELRKTLIDWFQNHVRFTDGDLAKFLKEIGHESVDS